MELIRILFLASNPVDTRRLRLDQEIRTIDERIQAGAFRDVIKMETAWAVRDTDLANAILRFDPHIVHFSGHGSPDGHLYFEDQSGFTKKVSLEIVAKLIRTASRQIRCIVLNACYSLEEAKHIKKCAEYVVGMPDSIGDSEAIVFSGGFYRGLSWGRSIQESFDLGCNEMLLANENSTTLPVLLSKQRSNLQKSHLLPKAKNSVTKYKEQDFIRTKIKKVYLHGVTVGNTTGKFYDREKEIRLIPYTILNSTQDKIITIYGRSGIGKSALLQESIKRAISVSQKQFYTLFCSANDLALGSLESLFQGLFHLLADRFILDIWLDHHTQLPEKISALTNRIKTKPIIIIIDNFEVLIEESGQFINKELIDLFESLITNTVNIKLLVASRQKISFPIALASYETPVVLREGLPLQDAIKFLTDHDKHGVITSSVDPKYLRVIATKTLGIPKALQVCVDLARNDLFDSLTSFTKQNTLLSDRVLNALLESLYNGLVLGESEKLVLDTLAILSRPASDSELQYIVQPFVSVNIRKTLNKMVSAHLVNFDSQNKQVWLHTIDQEIRRSNLLKNNLARMHNIERRIATYYEVKRGIGASSPKWTSIEDIQHILRAFDHRYRAGDYDLAAQIMGRIDREYLNTWGFSILVIKGRKKLIGKIKDNRLKIENYIELAYAYRVIGSVKNAFTWINKGKKSWYQHRDRELLLSLNLESIVILIKQGMLNRAEALSRETLALARELGDTIAEGKCYAHLGQVYLQKNDYASSELNLRLASEIARNSKDLKALSSRLDALGMVLLQLEKTKEAKTALKEALQISSKLHYKRGISVRLNGLGMIELKQNNFTKAIKLFKKGLDNSRGIGDIAGETTHLCNAARVYQRMGNFIDAKKNYLESIAAAKKGGSNDLLSLCYNNLGDLYFEHAKFSQAHRCFKIALGYAKKTQNSTNIKMINNNIFDLRKVMKKTISENQ